MQFNGCIDQFLSGISICKISLEQTINITADHFYELDSRPAFDKNTLQKLMQIATGGIFFYRDKCSLGIVL